MRITADEVRVYGERLMTLPEIQRMLRIFELVIARHGQVFVLLIAGEVSDSPTPEVRRCIAEWSRHHQVAGLALVGGTTFTRAVVTLTARAIALIRKGAQPVIFVETEVAAQKWFAELRKKAAAAPPSAARRRDAKSAF